MTKSVPASGRIECNTIDQEGEAPALMIDGIRTSGSRRTWRLRKLAATVLLSCVVEAGLAQPAVPVPLHELAGTYQGCRERIVLAASGTVQWQATHPFVGTDLVTVLSATGTIEADGDWLRLKLDPASLKAKDDQPAAAFKVDFTRRFYPVRIDGRTFMLDDNALSGVVNEANRFFPPVAVMTACFEQQPFSEASPTSPPHAVPAQDLLPANYRKLLQVRPLAGKVVQVGPVSKREINVAGWMRPADFREQSSASITVDLGASNNVFRGMRLFLGSPVESEIIVETVEADRSHGTARWLTAAPSAGMPVSSAQAVRP